MVSQILDAQFVTTFLEEAGDMLADLERHLLSLNKAVDIGVLDGLFRAAHNLKGSARSVGLDGFAKVIHHAEDIINLMRDNHAFVVPETIAALLAVQARLVEWRESLLADMNAPEPGFVAESKRLLIDYKDRLVQGSAALPGTPGQAYGIFAEEAAKPGPLAPSSEGNLPQSLPVAKETTEAKESKKPKSDRNKSSATNQEPIRVPAQKIDVLMQMIGELSTQQATISHCLKTNQMAERICHNAIQIASKLTRELQLQTMALRLVDLSRLFQRLERVAQDVAAEQGKKIQLVIHGSDVELDKSVIDRMTDPLVHMIRNAVDHGIESSGKRPTEKPEAATISLKAAQSASGVLIELTDDGRGIDPEKVLKKAQNLGIVREGDQISLEKIYQLLFAPGFSTAEKITDISGRGVGLDVVKRMVDDLDGTLEIHSELGKGTKFTILLPTNVSIVDSLVVLSSGQHYVIPIQEVAEVIDLRGYTIESQTPRGKTIALRDRAVTVCPLNAFIPDPLSLRRPSPSAKPPVSSRPTPAMIVEISDKKVGFEFEQVIGQQPVLIRKLANYMSGIAGFSGSTILATGEPAIILSPKVFARQYLAEKENR